MEQDIEQKFSQAAQSISVAEPHTTKTIAQQESRTDCSVRLFGPGDLL